MFKVGEIVIVQKRWEKYCDTHDYPSSAKTYTIIKVMKGLNCGGHQRLWLKGLVDSYGASWFELSKESKVLKLLNAVDSETDEH